MELAKYGFDAGRLEKRAEMVARGVNPYPYAVEGVQDISEVRGEAEAREAEPAMAGEPLVTVSGRVWAKRDMGKTVFLDLRDSTGKIQLYLKRGGGGETAKQILPLLDHGDIVAATGHVFRTRAGELTVNVEELSVLAKAVVPIPIGKETSEKTYYRMADTESRYRERYLSWLLLEEDRNRIQQRSRIISAVRNQMQRDGFLEVSTPTIEFIYGGAEARPFETSIWALDKRRAFLRISPELYLKRYIVAGFPKVFTICQNFRNEGIDHSHNPEFTMMEWYEAYTDYEVQMRRFESLVSGICEEICGSTVISYQGVELDFTPPWRRLPVLTGLLEYGEIDAANMSVEELQKELANREIRHNGPLAWGVAVAELFEKVCEDRLVQPTFVMDHPLEISPLTKVKRGDARLVERFEPFVYGMELGNAYSELTDPVDQLHRLEAQRMLGDGEYDVHPVDSDFIKAIGCGMPPTGGVGLGIDRLIMLLTNAPSIRDVIPFPMYKPHA